MLRAIVIANGQISRYNYVNNRIKDDDFIICADGGTNHIAKMSISPDLIIGDLDSSKKENIEKYAALGSQVNSFKKEKDETDTELAIKYVIEKGFNEVLLFGCTGTRFDHSFANVSLLKLCLENNISSCILDYYNEIYITNSTFKLEGSAGTLVSLLPLTDTVTGITTFNLKYKLNNASMTLGKPIGISNVMLGNECKVTIKNGLLLIIKSRE